MSLNLSSKISQHKKLTCRFKLCKVRDVIKQRLYTYYFLWMLYGMTQCLFFALASTLGYAFALFWFWGQTCDDTTICPTFSISLIQREKYKKVARECTPTNRPRDLYLLDIPRNFFPWAPLGTSHKGNPQRQILLQFWSPRYNPIIDSYEHVVWMFCDTYFRGHFGCGIRWKHSFVRLTKIEIKVRSRSGQIRSSLQTQNFHSESFLYCSSLL